jgi:hypothetical protein
MMSELTLRTALSARVRRAMLGGVLTTTVLVVGCSGGDQSVCDGIIGPTRVLMPNSPTLALDAGSTSQLTATLSGGCDSDDRTVRWQSSDPLIATVDSAGRVTAITGGSVTITGTAAVDQSQTAVVVTVRARLATTIDAKPDVDSLSPLGTRALSAVVRDQNGNVLATAAVAWRSLTPALATVTPQGVVTAVAAGTATIEAASRRTAADSVRDTVRILIVPACNLIRAIQVGTTVTGSIDASTCQNLYGYRVANQYSITTSTQAYYSVRLTAGLRSALVPLNIGASLFGMPASDTAVTAFVVVRPGTYGLLVTAPATTPQTFSFTTQLDPDPRTSCGPTDVTRGVTFRTAITLLCGIREVRLLPAATSSQLVRVTATAVSFPVTLEARNSVTGAIIQRVVATGANATATINFTNGSTSQFVLVRVIGPSGANDFVDMTVAP